MRSDFFHDATGLPQNQLGSGLHSRTMSELAVLEWPASVFVAEAAVEVAQVLKSGVFSDVGDGQAEGF